MLTFHYKRFATYHHLPKGSRFGINMHDVCLRLCNASSDIHELQLIQPSSRRQVCLHADAEGLIWIPRSCGYDYWDTAPIERPLFRQLISRQIVHVMSQ